MTSANITDFLSTLSKDVSRPSRFEVQIPIPLKLVTYRKMVDKLTMRCESAEFPSLNLQTFDKRTYGTTEKMPYLRQYNDVTFTFIVSGNMEEKKFFDAWVNLIIPRSSQNISFKDEYCTTITLTQFSVDGKEEYKINLTKAYPVSVGSLPLDWSNETTYHKLPITFTFFEIEPDGINDTIDEFVDSGVVSGVDMVSTAADWLFGSSSDDWKMENIATKLK